MKKKKRGKTNGKERRAVLLLLLVLFGSTVFFRGADSLLVGPGFAGEAVAAAEGDWRQEFEEVCSMTQDAMALSIDELDSLVKRCDKLKGQIEKLDESTRKVYLRRLRLCRDLYLFALDSKRQE